MTDHNNRGWQELELPSRRQCPKLFYSLSTQNEAIKLLLTDLISIWECSLDKYDVLAEASRQHTSIDPAASSDQFAVLLSKIAKSLSHGNNVLVRANERSGHVLRLKTTVDLPKPLRPLEWTFKLVPQPASELAERILRPSLHEVAVSQEKIASLLRIMRDKDHVISRLLDRIDSSAIDLSLIFPSVTGVASRKGGHISVSEVRKHVPGMVSFNETAWTKQFANDDGYEGADRTGLSNLVRGCENCFAHTRSQHEDWINGLPSSDISIQHSEKNRSSSPLPGNAAAVPGESGGESTASDDFERQATPPDLSSHGRRVRRPANVPNDDGIKKEVALPNVVTPSPSRIGALGRRHTIKAGGKSEIRRDSSTSSDQPLPLPRGSSAASTATATPSPSDDNVGTDSEPQALKRQRGKTKTGNTPKLGGLRKKREASLAPSPSPSPTSTSRSQHKRRDHRRVSHATESSPRPDSPVGRAPSPRRNSDSTSTGSDLDTTRHRKPNLKSNSAARAKKSPEPPAPTPKRRLGRIGRKIPSGDDHAGSPASRLSPSSTKLANPSSRPQEAAASPEQARPRARLDDDSDRTGSPSPSPLPARSTSKSGLATHLKPSTTSPVKEKAMAAPPSDQGDEKQETEEQKADRRRLELKRTLAASTGAKKKRRF